MPGSFSPPRPTEEYPQYHVRAAFDSTRIRGVYSEPDSQLLEEAVRVPQPVFLGPLHPRHGPHEPTSGTPGRAPGSVRRTVTTDMLRPDGVQGPLHLVGRACDLYTAADGTPQVLGDAAMTAVVDFIDGWLLRSLHTDPQRPQLAAVLGSGAGSGFRGRLLAADPRLPQESGLLHQLLDDVPMTTLVSGVALHAELSRTGDGAPRKSGRGAFGRDMCAGFADGGTIMREVDTRGLPPMVTGPVAPPLTTEDPLAWHDLPELPPNSLRRSRRTDVLPGPRPRVEVLYRDSYVRQDGLETVVHEYTVEAVVDPDRGTFASCRALPRVLPWLECPSAAASAERLAGVRLDGLRRHVRAGFVGTSTCTHLNDTLRSLEDVPELLTHLQ
jgi:hypothetical protein